ncbi:PREDICTED: zinc finger BED domain-containing protein 4-like [Rhagoletis zephyria]|uniref:zinc finger BED domain-containing protein 4-like n=1 Tax=Rhagoletis zephyria TaxID=28612 RepID=UPI0008112EA4|nr:PREDICTED: zinc finger BED domain-containing protein 4-like [Rhagoletis zephyria]
MKKKKRNSDASATCKLCNKNLKTSGNTSNLRCHIEKVHKQILLETQSSDKAECSSEAIPHTQPKQQKISEIISIAPTPSPLLSEVSESTNEETACIIIESQPTTCTPSVSGSKSKSQLPTAALIQPNVKDFFEQVKSISSQDGTRPRKITEAIVKFIIMDNKPFSAVEGNGFLQLMKEVVPLYKVPSRKTIKLRVDEKYEALSCIFKEHIRKCESFCLTYDVWTETMKNQSFLGVTIHFLDNLRLLSGTLGVLELHESHTAAYLGEHLSRLFIEWKVSTDKVSACVTDNDSTMMKLNRNLFGDKKIIPCFAHTLNLVVTQAIDKSTEVSALISKVRDIVKFIKRSVNASDELRKKQIDAGASEERFVQLASILSEVLLTRPEAPSMVTGSDLNNIKEVIELLKSFEIVTREISADTYVTFSKVIPLNIKSKQSNLSTITTTEVEVQMYLGSAVAPINQNPIEMWDDMKKAIIYFVFP